MKKEEGEKDIVGDSENDVRDNFTLEHSPELLLLRCGAAPVQALVPHGAVWVKANDVICEDKVFKGPTKNVLEKQHGSTSHAIDTNVPGTSSTENEAINTSRQRWIQPHLGGDNSTLVRDNFNHRWIQIPSVGDKSSLVREIEFYEKLYIKKVEQKIQKVPTILRGDNKCYDPMIVAIGPYHHVKLKQMETFKFQFTLQYVNQSGKSIKKLYEEMEELLNYAKNYYTEDVAKDFSNEEFADMMFLDSCFVIQFMDSCVNPQRNDIKTKYIETSLIMRDILLLENQLPFKILTKLMNLSLRFKGGEGEKMIDDFIKLIMNVPHTEEEGHERKTCFWFCQTNYKLEETSKKKKEPIQKEPIHLLELVQTKFVDDKEIKNGASEKPSHDWCLYRSVKELKSVGIHFQPSKSRRFSDITFKSMLLYGRLKLPQITIHDGTESLLLNLVAFETCADTLSNFGVSSYVYFMDTLIDHAEDVKELRSKGIILNLLGCDDQVATIFNDINKNLVPNNRVFGDVKDSLNTFYRSYPRLWLAECLYNHFRSPWTIIAFFAAIVVLGLTITQTVFSSIQL